MENSNVFFDQLAADLIEAEPIDLSLITKTEILSKNTVMLRLAINGSSLQKQFGSGEVIHAEGIDTTMVKTSKSLVDKKYLDPISKLDSRMNRTCTR